MRTCKKCKKDSLTDAHFVASKSPDVCSQCANKGFMRMFRRRKEPGKQLILTDQRLARRPNSHRDLNLQPPPPPMDEYFGEMVQDMELVRGMQMGRGRSHTIRPDNTNPFMSKMHKRNDESIGLKVRPHEPLEFYGNQPYITDPRTQRKIKFVDPAFPETLKPYEDKDPDDPLEEFERRLLDPAGSILTAREFILLMDFERRSWLELSTLYWVPFNFREYLELAKLLVKHEYASRSKGSHIEFNIAANLIKICHEIAKIAKPKKHRSYDSGFKAAFRSRAKNQHLKNQDGYHLKILDILSAQVRHELGRLKDDLSPFLESHRGTSFCSDYESMNALEFFETWSKGYDVEDVIPEHLKCSVGKWYWNEKGYQIASLGRASAAFVTSVLDGLGKISAQVATTSGSILGPISVVLAPVGVVFEGKHLDNNKINTQAILKIIEDLKNTGKITSHEQGQQMLRDARLFGNSKLFAKKYGGKIDYQAIKEEIDNLGERLKAISRGSKIRWVKIAGTVLGGICACAAIVVTGGVAAVVIMGVGIAAAVVTNAATVVDTVDWNREYDERWKLAHTMLEAAKQESVFLKLVKQDQEYVIDQKAQVVPYPTINMLVKMGLFTCPADAIMLNFSDAFIYTQVQLAMALGNSAVADRKKVDKT